MPTRSYEGCPEHHNLDIQPLHDTLIVSTTMMSTQLRALLGALALLALPLAGAAQPTSDIYSFISSYFNPDPNAGLTAFRSLHIPMGGLAEGMGMAYTAAARDSSYFEANPAASAIIDQTELGVFHNNWISDTKIESAVYTLRAGNLGFGVMGKWLYLPFVGVDDFANSMGTGYYSEAIAAFNASYNFFQGYNFTGIALGATGKLAYRSVPTTLAKAAGNSGLGLMVDGGALIRFNFLKLYSSRTKNFAVGLALKNVGPPVLNEPLPTVASLGLSWSPFRFITFSGDVAKPVNLMDLSKSERPIYAAGFAISMTDAFGLQGGILMKGSNPRISVGSMILLDLVKLNINYTLDLTTQFTPLNRISIQTAFVLGDLGRSALAKKVDRLYLEGLGEYGKGNADAAITLWNQALAADPTFDPARESLHAAENSKKLKAAMDAIGTMNLSPKPGN